MYQQRNPDGNWKFTVAKFYRFMAVILAMSLFWAGGAYSIYWSNQEYAGYRSVIGNVLPLYEFQTILKYMSWADRSIPRPQRGQEGYDPLWKTRWLQDELNKCLKEHYQPSDTCAGDESMNPYKGKKIFWKQYMKDKPTKWGEKRQIMACSQTAAPLHVETYLGKHGGLDEASDTGGKSADAIMQAVRALQAANTLKEGDCIVMDNWYSSINLFKQLWDSKLYAVGTIRTNRKGFCKALAHTADTAKGLLRGTTLWRMKLFDTIPMLSVMYKDNKPVHFLSTLHGDPSSSMMNRKVWDKASRAFKLISMPVLKHFYDHKKNAVDRLDQLLAAFPLTFVTKKPWHRNQFGLIAIFVTTAYIYARMYKRKNRLFGCQRKFRALLASELVDKAEQLEAAELKRQQQQAGNSTASGRLQHAQHAGRGAAYRPTGVFPEAAAHYPDHQDKKARCVVCRDDLN